MGKIKKKKRSDATLNRETDALKRILYKAVQWKMALSNPVKRVKKLKEPKGRLRYLEPVEAKALLDCATADLKGIILCALETGMRRGEIFNLHWEDVDYKNRQIYIRDPKNSEPRYVPMSERMLKAFRDQPKHLGSDLVFVRELKIGKNGRPTRFIWNAFKGACKAAGITNFRFHDLRHTFASWMVMEGVPLKTVADILGHKSIAMTMIYAHLSPDHRKKAIEQLPDWTGENRCHKTATSA